MWLHRDKLKHMDEERIDKLICTEIPNECKDNEFDATTYNSIFENNNPHAAVTHCMLHGPCTCTIACVKQGSCKCGYLKDRTIPRWVPSIL